MKKNFKTISLASLVLILGLVLIVNTSVIAQPLAGGTLDPTTIPKYVTPLVIPPVMKNDGTDDNNYDIAVRQFKQQILPGGIWNGINGRADAFPATTLWSYGPAGDPEPAGGIAPAANSQFNYPAYTIETTSHVPVDVRWINDLVDDDGNYLPHLLPLDQTLHWANPPATGCRDGDTRTDCATNDPTQYTGPVPIVTHVHGAHVDPESDGYPEAWWLPAANDIPSGYTTSGSLFTTADGNSGDLGYADYSYRQDQPATTLWYHDHSLGMTRLNVYAGPAGFWLIRGGANDGAVECDTGLPAVLPGPAPVAGQGVLALNIPTDPVRQAIREVPIVIQDRSFNEDGSLFYPDNRAFFEGLNVEGTAGGPDEQFPGEPELQIPFVGDDTDPSDIAPAWNPEAFFNVMVVNGVSWPTLEVAPAMYRFRLLNGCNSRFLNLALEHEPKGKKYGCKGKKHGRKSKKYGRKGKKHERKGKCVPFYQIGAEQGFLRQVVRIETGFATPLPGDGRDVNPNHLACKKCKTKKHWKKKCNAKKHWKKKCKAKKRWVVPVPATDPQQALLMGLAERADVIVDFRDLEDGDIVMMTNTAPDAPFGGFPDDPADPSTSGQVMQFVINSALSLPGDEEVTSPQNLVMNAEAPLDAPGLTRQVSLNEGESESLCVEIDLDGNVVAVAGDPHVGCLAGSFPMGPKEALLGTVDLTDPNNPIGVPLKWTADGVGVSRTAFASSGPVNVWVTENPGVGDIEDWEIYNFTADAHPIHQHLVRFEVINRRPIPGWDPVNPIVQPWENGMKDTVISYPGEITTIRSKFDVAGLYVWHCHIVEHEDNEMMRPYFVGP